MNDMQTPSRLHRHLAAMVALERTIGQRIEYLLNLAILDSEIRTLLKDVWELTDTHQQALADRLQVVAAGMPIPDSISVVSPHEGFYDEVRFPTSAALMSLYTLFDQAVIGYAVLTVLARRAADSGVRGVGNTDDLVQQHTRNYTATLRKIVRLLPGVVVAELEQEGQECQCSCPSCGLGVCLCAVSTRRALDMAWTDAGPIYMPGGISMVRPRSGSAAARAGLQRGDVVLTVDGQNIETIPMLQETIRSHQTGQEIRFLVQRESGEPREVRVVRP